MCPVRRSATSVARRLVWRGLPHRVAEVSSPNTTDSDEPLQDSGSPLARPRNQFDYLPLFVRLRDRSALVVGGGTVATRKAELLHRAGAAVSVVAPAIGDEMRLAANAAQWRLLERAFQARDIEHAALVVAATDDSVLNRQISELARERGLPVNVVDDPAASSFIFPAVVDRAPVVVAVGSGGHAPLLARRIRALIESLLPSNLGGAARRLGELRPMVRERYPDATERRLCWERAADRVLAGGQAAADLVNTDPQILLAQLDAQPESSGRVALVGAGPGDPDLLTLKAHRWLQRADVIVHDRLVDPAVLDLARRDARRVDVGKAAGRHAMPQQQINALLVREAAAGRVVVRLKGGDPFVFGRGGEELEALAAAGIVTEVVPGVTAATGCAAAALIPLTHREVASACVFVTGHARGGAALAAQQWAALARLDASLVVYMGVGNLADIVLWLQQGGRSRKTPAAVIDRGTTPAQQVVVGTLETIVCAAQEAGVGGPAVVLVGEVVALRQRFLTRSGAAPHDSGQPTGARSDC